MTNLITIKQLISTIRSQYSVGFWLITTTTHQLERYTYTTALDSEFLAKSYLIGNYLPQVFLSEQEAQSGSPFHVPVAACKRQVCLIKKQDKNRNIKYN